MFNKQDEKLLQEIVKKHKQGIISGLITGDNITMTPTGCRDKVISASGRGGSFLTELQIVPETRALQTTDVGKVLFLLGGVNLTFANVFTDMDIVGVFVASTGNTVGINPGDTVELVSGELIMLIYANGGFTPISSLVKENKTALKYLLDNVDERGSIVDLTTSALSASDLNIAYPNAKDGFRVIAPDIIGGGQIYTKANTSWYYQQILLVV